MLSLFPNILRSDENITKKIVLTDHQLNELEAVPAEEVEELPEAIIIPVQVTVHNLTAQNQKILLSREREHSLFSGLGLFVVLGMYAAVLVVEIYVTGVEMQVWAVVGDVYGCKYIVILSYFYSKLHLGIVGHIFFIFEKICVFFAFFRSRFWKKQNFL